MAKLPADIRPDNAGDFARFSTQVWGEMDGFYNFWGDRWRAVLDFIRSQHWNTTRILKREAIPSWEEFPVVNFTGAFYADYMKQWMQSKVRFSALPDSPDGHEIDAAELADHLLAYLWDRLVEPMKGDLGAWLVSTGNANLRVFWNTDTGNMLPLAIPGPDGQLIPVNPTTLKPDPTMQEPIMVDAGDIGVEVVSPQLVRWPFNKAHGAMVGCLLSYDEALTRYGEDIAKQLKYQKARTSLATHLLTLDGSNIEMDTGETALLLEHYLPRSSRFPQGVWWTASDRVAITPPQPLPGGVMPIIPFRWVPMPGHPTLGISPMYDVRNTNKIFEKSLKRELESMRKIIPKRLLVAGGGIKKGDFTEEPAQEITYNAGAEPKYDMMPSLPRTFDDVRREASDAMQMVGLYRFREPDKLPPGDATARFRQPQTFVQGQEMALAIINSYQSWVQLGYVLLGYVGKFYTEPRSVGIVGPDRSYQWREFVGSDLQNMRATLRLDETALYTWNRQSIRDTTVALLGSPAGQTVFMGADGQPDRERINRAMEATGMEQSLQTLDPDVLEARNEISSIRGMQDASQPIPASLWQNHPTHLAEKYKVLKSITIRGWSDVARQLLMQNIGQHEQMEAAMQKQQQDAMMQQEQQLRQIRAIAEAGGNARTALAEALAKVLAEVLSGDDGPPKKKS